MLLAIKVKSVPVHGIQLWQWLLIRYRLQEVPELGFELRSKLWCEQLHKGRVCCRIMDVR